MEFHQLEVFVKVAQLQSFSKAAQALYLTQPTVSAHISSLEKEVGTRLFDRIGREVLLTPAGKLLYNHAISIIKARQNAICDLKEYLGVVEGELYICASSIPAVYILPHIVMEFNKIYPDVIVNVKQMDSGEVIMAVENDSVELGIAGSCPENGNMVALPLCKDEMALITPGDFFKENDKVKEVNIEEIKHENFVMREKTSGTRMAFEKALKKKGMGIDDFKIVAEFGSSEAIKQAVKEGLGISVISKRAIKDYVDMGFIKAYSIKNLKISRSFYLIYKKCKTIPPHAQAFVKFLSQAPAIVV